ncbi:MAG: hypothetical protein CML68_06335 [Rhodobacteraceae bacterium]|nr:hypothetical protein [Paracoccaceae bacterium]
MTRPLDFLVYGLARSGTSAVASYLSAVPGVHCGVEVFPTFLDHGAIRAPRDFLSHEDPLWQPSSVRKVEILGASIRVWGNKTPTYFYNLAALYDQLGPVPSLLCLRGLDKVAASYSMRAADPEDSWPRGRTGLFAYGDALVLLHALTQLDRCDHILTVPQAELTRDWRGVMDTALAHVTRGASPAVAADYDAGDLARIERRRETSAARRKPAPRKIPQVERDAFGKMRKIGAAAFFDSDIIAPVETRRDEIREILAAAPPDPVQWMRRAVARHPNRAVADFLTPWTAHVARVTRRLQKVAG